MKELKPGDKVKVWGPSIPQAWFSGQEVELVAHGGGIGFWENGTLYCVHERQVEKIEPEKCPARRFADECVRAKGHPDGHLWESETLKPKEPAPKPGDERCTGRGFEVFRSGGWMLGTREGFFVRRKPSTDPRYVALCALESLGSDKRLDACASEIRMHLRNLPANFVKAGKGRNPHATPRRKDDRRG